MQPYITLSYTRLALRPCSDLFNCRAGPALIVGVPLASELVLLLANRVQLGGRIFPKEIEVQ
jgi:hypothetical protein